MRKVDSMETDECMECGTIKSIDLMSCTYDGTVLCPACYMETIYPKGKVN
jgi:uncharacterized Zn finger protein (UPF0148 family)